MESFSNGEADCLIATTIVESGLDIPNCNTIIIENVQFFGLASLYQLRGRVGRAGRQAYAYMFHTSDSAELSPGRARASSSRSKSAAAWAKVSAYLSETWVSVASVPCLARNKAVMSMVSAQICTWSSCTSNSKESIT
jgi:ERCC4-related helicase